MCSQFFYYPMSSSGKRYVILNLAVRNKNCHQFYKETWVESSWEICLKIYLGNLHDVVFPLHSVSLFLAVKLF
jgi:hypothetical protein